jgi:hypothetical protein
VRRHAQRVPGMVIQPGQDLGIGPAGERVVGEVGLPALVRLLSGEPDAGRLRPLARLRGDQPSPHQVPADRSRRHGELMVVTQVPADRVRPGIQALPGQLLAQGNDQIGGGVADRIGRGLRPPRPWLERRLALHPVAGDQPGHPALGHAIGAGRFALATALGEDSGDDKACLRHPPTVPARPYLCPETRREIARI